MASGHAPLPRRTLALAAVGLVTLPCMAPAEEKLNFVESANSTITLSGYVDTSAIWRIGESGRGGAVKPFPNTYRSPGRLYDTPAKANGFNLNSVSIELDKPLDEARWSAGYHVQVLFGPDVPLRNVYALAGDGPADVGLNEAYVMLRAPLGNGLDFRLGHFNSPLGYEVYDSHRNPNYSRSYGYFIEPKSHTGATVSYKFAEWMSALVGVGNSYSSFIDARSTRETVKAYLATLTFTGAGFSMPDASVTFGYTGGNTATSAPTDTAPRIHNFYAGARVPLPLKGLAVGVAYDYQWNAGANEPAAFFEPEGPESTYANATALYLTYAIARWDLAARAEYASGTAGNSIFASRSGFGSDKPINGANNEQFLGVTATVGYKFWDNVVSRLEFRWDRDVSGGVPTLGTAAHPRQNSFTLALNVIYRF
jgi:Putative beta-barrel porin-2, OmpL-like. bbp2